MGYAGFPWSVLIAAAATVTAALGAVRYTARQTARDRVTDVRREAYAALVTAANAAADFYNARPSALRLMYDRTVIVELNRRTDDLAAAVNQAAAVVQIVGSAAAAKCAARVAVTANDSVTGHLESNWLRSAVSDRQEDFPASIADIFFRDAINKFIFTARAELTPHERRPRRRPSWAGRRPSWAGRGPGVTPERRPRNA